jgi:TonB family protein
LIPLKVSALLLGAAAVSLAVCTQAAESAIPVLPVLDAIEVPLSDDHGPSRDSTSGLRRQIGSCEVLVWVTADGTIRAAQVIKSTGYVKFDAACWKAALGKKIEPARRADGQPLDSWAMLPIVWQAVGRLAKNRAKPPDRPDTPIAILMPDQELHLKPLYYPERALRRREQGDCLVHVEVSATGLIQDLRIAQGSGSMDIDAASITALRDARFIPGERDEKPVTGGADIALLWLLPANP